MNHKQIQKWEKTRQMGPWKYALIYGSIWGIVLGGFIILFNQISKTQNKYDLAGYIITFSIYIITGIILYRFIFWRAKEKVYRAWKDGEGE